MVGGVAGIFFFWPMASVVSFFATTSWLTRGFWRLCCLLAMDIRLSSFVIRSYCRRRLLCVRKVERSLGRVIPSYHLWLLKFLLHTKEASSPGPSDVLTWSLLSLRRLFVHLLLRSEFQGLRGGLLCLLFRDFSLLDLFFFFFSRLLRRRRLLFAKGCFSFLFLLIPAGELRVSVEITLGWRRYCDKFFSCLLVRMLGDPALV